MFKDCPVVDESYDGCTSSQVDCEEIPIGNNFLAASTECSAGSNDHFVVGVGVGGPSLVQFDGRPLGGANFQY
jgi:hypothetical protein